MKYPAKLGILAALLTTPVPALASGSIQVIAVDNGEGSENWISYSAFTNPVLNEAGQAAFVGFRVLGGFSQPDLAGGVYVGDGRNPLVELIRVGDPGFLPDSFADGFSVEAINDVGQVACSERASSTTGDYLGPGLFLRAAGTAPTLVVKRGDLDPDGDTITSFDFGDLDADGRVGLQLSHPDGFGSLRSTAIFETGGFRVLAKEEQPAPDGVGTVALTGAFLPALNDAGQILYSPRIARPGFPQRPVIFRETPGVGRELLLRSEDATSAPDFDGTILLGSYSPSMNETGLVVETGTVTGASDPANNGAVLLVMDAPNAVIALVREGQVVPGGDTMAFFGRPSLNESGAVAFYALLTDDPEADHDPENVGIYRQSPAGLTQIARDGQPAPTGDGMIDLPRFGSPGSLRFNLRPMFNDNGQVAFLADLAGTSSGSPDAHAIFFFDDALGLIEVARTGYPLLEGTIVNLGLLQSTSNDGDEEIGFNDAGQIAFRFALDDGREGVAIWSPDATDTSFKLIITRATAPATGYNLEWDSKPGKVYDLVTSPDLATPVPEWPVYQSYGNIPASGTTTTLTAVPREGARRFFAVVEKDAVISD